ncbi:MAG: tetratricopeptide repeat protein [Hasllibacter sp.]
MRRPRTIAAALALLALAACESAEERAEGHYRSALALIGEGDVARATVEFRNVFELNGTHRDARAAYAALMRESGNARESYGQYLRLVEQYPEDVEALRALAVMAAERRDWDAARRYSETGLRLAPDAPDLKAAAAAVAYRDALGAGTPPDEAVAAAAGALGADPALGIARRVLIDARLRAGEPLAAARLAAEGLELAPGDGDLWRMRIAALGEAGEEEAAAEALRNAVAARPDDDELTQALIAYLLTTGDADEVEALMRARIAGPEDADGRAALVALLRQAVGPEAALAEVDALLADPETPEPGTFRGLRAALLYEMGRRDEGVTEIEALVEATEDPARRAELLVALAQMRQGLGDRVGARAAVEMALEDDPALASALKLQAAWLIDEDRQDEAIEALRTALVSTPRDAAVMSLLARAHLRAGDRTLAEEMLAQAFDLSDSAPREALAYARFLVAEGRLTPARDTLQTALRRAPADIGLLSALGDVHLAEGDWLRLRGVEGQLREIGGEAAIVQADRLAALRLERTGQEEELSALLSGLSSGGGRLAGGAALALIRDDLAEGRIESAFERLDAIEDGDEVGLAVLRAGILSAAGRRDEAEALARDLVAERPEAEEGWLLLHRLVREDDGRDAAAAILERGVEAVPDGDRLALLLAGERERQEDIEGAIALYERVYEARPDNVVVANNLASLLSTARDDPESLDRAWRVARRLRGADNPALQDTYGWIVFRRGETETALEYLRPAAEGLPDDARVQYHLAAALEAAGDAEGAAEALAAAEALQEAGGPSELSPLLEALRARLDAEGDAEGGAEGGAGVSE